MMHNDIVNEESGVVNIPAYQNARQDIRQGLRPIQRAVSAARDLRGKVRLVVQDEQGNLYSLDVVDVVDATPDYDELSAYAQMRGQERSQGTEG